MKITSKVYTSVNCNRDVVAELVGDAVPDGHFSFVLIDDHIVPNSFIDFVADAVCDTTFPYGSVFSVRDYMTAPLYECLDEEEHQVLGGVIMLLIEQGRVAIEFPPDECDDEDICTGCKNKGG
jgi:hypothetical protein